MVERGSRKECKGNKVSKEKRFVKKFCAGIDKGSELFKGSEPGVVFVKKLFKRQLFCGDLCQGRYVILETVIAFVLIDYPGYV